MLICGGSGMAVVVYMYIMFVPVVRRTDVHAEFVDVNMIMTFLVTA